MSGMVLTEKGTVLDRTSIFPLSADEKQSQEIGKLKGAYGARLADKLKNRVAGLAAGKDAGMLENEELQQQEKEWLEEMATPEFV